MRNRSAAGFAYEWSWDGVTQETNPLPDGNVDDVIGYLQNATTTGMGSPNRWDYRFVYWKDGWDNYIAPGTIIRITIDIDEVAKYAGWGSEPRIRMETATVHWGDFPFHLGVLNMDFSVIFEPGPIVLEVTVTQNDIDEWEWWEQNGAPDDAIGMKIYFSGNWQGPTSMSGVITDIEIIEP